MKFSSSPRSFALLAVLFFATEPTSGHLIQRGVDGLQLRLDGSFATAPISSSSVYSSTIRRRKSRCSRTATSAATSPYPSASGYGAPFKNATILDSSLPYIKSPASFADVGNSGSPDSPAGVTKSSVCGQSTTTVTNERTVTVTVGSGASPTSLNAGGSPSDGYLATSTSDALVSLPSEGATATSAKNNGAAHTAGPLYNNSLASSPVNSNVTTDTSDSTGLTTTSKMDERRKTSSTGTYDAVGAFVTGSSTSQSSSENASTSTTPTATGSALITGLSTNQNSSNIDRRNGEIWAGACIDTVPRAKALPGRTFYDFDGKTVKDPIDTLADAGVNAFRVQASRGNCLGPEPFATTTSPLDDEDDFKLDFGCIDVKVKLAKQAIALGMRMQLTINQGLNIPQSMETYSYAEMVQEVQKETKRQLQPFLDANIVPDIILFENEGTDGFLFHEEATGHNRGQNDGKASEDVVNQERCGQIPTGKMDSYPQLAGYYKAEYNACSEAIKAAGHNPETVRYGLHSHGQYVQWKESVVHGPKRASETLMKKLDGSSCEGPSPIPANILAFTAYEVLTIAGFSAYAEPMRPTDINSETSLKATFGRLSDTLTQIQGYSEEFGKYTSGPFQGQYRLQALGVEYASHFEYPNEISQQQKHTEMMWDMVRKFSATTIGMLWWEPWYCNNHWEGGKATLCHLIPGPRGSGILGEAPTNSMKTWGAAARSS
ncbi:MAG: hypothetical protein Q9213_005297 [Squamulea squamosa]